MDRTVPDKTSAPGDTPAKGKADLVRDQILASDAELVAAWAEAIARTVETHRRDPHADAAHQKMQADLLDRTQACLNQVGELAITVDEVDLLFAGRIVFHSATEAGSIPAALYRAGVRELVLRQGVEPWEVRELVVVMEAAIDGSGDGSDDAVTLLWDRNFQHIEYTSIPMEELDEELSANGPGDPARESPEGIPWPPSPLSDDETEPAGMGTPDEMGAPTGRSDDWAFHPTAGPPWNETARSQFALTDVEAENIRMVARIEEVHAPDEQVLEILSMVLTTEENPAEYLEIASIMGRLTEQAVMAGDLERAGRLLERLRGIPASKGTARTEAQEATEQVTRDLARPELMVRFGAMLNKQREVNSGALTKFLVQLGSSAAPTLCDLLGEIADMKVRKALCEALAISCKNNVEVLIERLSDPRWYVVRNILYVLGRIGHQGVERALGEALYHADVRVRREAVRALAGIDSPTSRAYLNSALRDPDRSVRILVAQMVARRVDERAAQILWNVIESPEFAGRDADERSVFFVALGRSGSDALMPQLERVLTRGGLFRTGAQGGRKEAALALAWIGTPTALTILNREVKSVREEVRRAVEEALEAVRRASTEKRRTG